MKTTFLLTLIVALLFTSCKKRFPDGPLISFRSKLERIQGVWNLSAYLVNGVDSTRYYNNYFGNQCIFDFGLLPEDDAATLNINWGVDSTRLFMMSAAYTFATDINFSAHSSIFNSARFICSLSDTSNLNVNNNYQILKLKYKEVWLRANDFGNTYEFHLTNIKKY